ncbi:MAG: Na/Pi cotransporter family protein [Kiritimatiellia bacterium]
MGDEIKMITTVLGGLALFVYGMGLMSNGLKETAGERMKAVLGYMTRNRVCAILAGATVTALVQSSSATSVMTVGFVNAGLLSLEQAIGVVFGANIGTTVTGQIVSLKLGDVALPAVTLGVLGLMIARRTVSRGAWRTVLGFGLLFFGMNLMSQELKALAKEPGFVSFFSLFDCTPGASGRLPPFAVLGAVAVGTLCTMVVQSSSATIGITIALAEAGVISFWTAVPIVLGDNIGTTATAALASIGGNANAKRTALAHALFNVLGTCLVVLSFGIVLRSGDRPPAPAFFLLVDALTSGDGFAGEAAGRHVAMAHTVFNVANVVVLSFFIPLLARFCQKVIRSDRSRKTVRLEPHLLEAPEMALHAARLALGEMMRRSWTIASAAVSNCLGHVTVDEDSMENGEKEIDEMQLRIRDYLVALSQRKLTERQAQMLPELVHCVNDAERISDIALRIYRKTARVQSAGIPDDLTGEIDGMLSAVRAFAKCTVSSLLETLPIGRLVAGEARDMEETIRLGVSSLTHRFAQAASAGDGKRPRDLAFLSVLSALRDISRHIGNVAERLPVLV